MVLTSIAGTGAVPAAIAAQVMLKAPAQAKALLAAAAVSSSNKGPQWNGFSWVVLEAVATLREHDQAD
jgi:hypothetical protein